jgi:HD-like signal output (HDOD) protein
MAIDSALQSPDIDVPTRPDVLAKLTLLLAEEDVDLPQVSALIEKDMALAAGLMKAVNSPLYGLKGRVQNIQQAVTYLGTREVAAATFEICLRAVFPPNPTLNALWERASLRGVLMGRLAQALRMDAWCAHTAGLFEECGKAVLYKHAPEVYAAMLAQASDDTALIELEHKQFGISHDLLGAQLCEGWGLSPTTVASVHHHVHVIARRQLPRVPHRSICVLSALAHAMVYAPETVDEVAGALAPQAMMDQTLLLSCAHKVKDKIDDAIDNA